MLGVIFLADDLDEVGEACIGVVVFSVYEGHNFVGFFEFVVVDEIYRRLRRHRKREDQDEAYGPLDGEDVAESLLGDVGDETADDAESDALHEDCEENECGLGWSTEFERCDLIYH
jgi:hypothetical protein